MTAVYPAELPPPLPDLTEQCDLQVHARVRAAPDQVQLVWALTEFMRLVGPYVRCGMSAPAMVDAYRLGLDALRSVAEQADEVVG